MSHFKPVPKPEPGDNVIEVVAPIESIVGPVRTSEPVEVSRPNRDAFDRFVREERARTAREVLSDEWGGGSSAHLSPEALQMEHRAWWKCKYGAAICAAIHPTLGHYAGGFCILSPGHAGEHAAEMGGVSSTTAGRPRTMWANADG